MNKVTLTFKIEIRASQLTVFDYVADWERQSDWIMFTTVKQLSDPAKNSDIYLAATTKVGPFKVVDTMAVTTWQPPEKIVIEHTGRQVLGKGVFMVKKISDDRCEFVWEEITPIPFAAVGRIGLFILMPFIRFFYDKSLRRMKAVIERGTDSTVGYTFK